MVAHRLQSEKLKRDEEEDVLPFIISFLASGWSSCLKLSLVYFSFRQFKYFGGPSQIFFSLSLSDDLDG